MNGLLAAHFKGPQVLQLTPAQKFVYSIQVLFDLAIPELKGVRCKSIKKFHVVGYYDQGPLETSVRSV